MGLKCPKIYYKYVKCIFLIVTIAFFVQIFIAFNYIPSDNLTDKYRTRLDIASARNPGFDNNENVSLKKKDTPAFLRAEELDFEPACKITGKEAISAVRRAKTQVCKKQIVDKTCLIISDKFYAQELPNQCYKGGSYGHYLGCYQDEKKMRLFSSFYGTYANINSPDNCINICIQAGFTYAGIQYALECFCGDNKPPDVSKIDDSQCDMVCPGDSKHRCGGYFTMNVYETGLAKFSPQVPKLPKTEDKASVRIIFLLTLNGRALRQVYRLINTLYNTNHYFYIHVDARQDYLHRELSVLENNFPNVKLATTRFSTIWGGASLLQMLLASMREMFELGWQWDYVINLSESDFPIKSLDDLEKFLSLNKGLNFVKSHGQGEGVHRFIKKQGLDKTFIECDTHMWRVGERKLPKGIVIDGGSDWIALSTEFVSYVVGEKDELLTGLETVFQHTLLPAESFFHTVLRNSRFCNTYVDNNLHLANWKRKLGCKCQYTHIVDWCGCSPNVFRLEDWTRLQSTQDHQRYFARKFEPIINIGIINRVEQNIGITDHHLISNLEAYWESIYNINDLTSATDDLFLSHGNSIIRQNVKLLSEEDCQMQIGDIIEMIVFKDADVYRGNLILYKGVINNVNVIVETWYKPKRYFNINKDNYIAINLEEFKVGSDYDQKEMTFRNFANILGPLSDPTLMYKFLSLNENKATNLTILWLDPSGALADISYISIEDNNLTNFIKPNLKQPMLPGIWQVFLIDKLEKIAETKFLISPLEYFSGKEMTHEAAIMIHSGSQNSYKKHEVDQYSFLPNLEERILTQNVSDANIKRLQQDLIEWIDSLSYLFYKILNSCVNYPINNVESVSRCSQHRFKDCSTSRWSSLSPDPKGRIGVLNKKTGRLERL